MVRLCTLVNMSSRNYARIFPKSNLIGLSRNTKEINISSHSPGPELVFGRIIVIKRIEAHICIAFTAYCVYKELKTALYRSKSTLSLKTAAEITHNIYQLTYQLPESKHTKHQLLKMDEQQTEIIQIINNFF
jgi:hypothetical protein